MQTMHEDGQHGVHLMKGGFLDTDNKLRRVGQILNCLFFVGSKLARHVGLICVIILIGRSSHLRRMVCVVTVESLLNEKFKYY